MGKKLRSLKKAARKLGAARGIFKKAGSKLRPAKSLPNKGVRPPRMGPPAPGSNVLRQPPRLDPRASPYRPDIAAQVPARRGRPTDGVIDLGGERVISQSSTYAGPNLDRTVRAGRTLNSHVEMHAIAAMRKNNLKEATVYINNVDGPCSFTSGRGADGCSVYIKKLLQSGEKLTVYWPPNRHQVFTGD